MRWAMIALLSLMQAEGPKKDGSASIRQLTPTLRVDMVNRVVEVEAEVVLREGPLELLLCPRRTKEHESILATEIDPRHFQLALLMVGAVPGSPARFETKSLPNGQTVNEMRPPTGQPLKIWVERTRNGRQTRTDARQWVRDAGTQKTLAAPFVFAGSGFATVAGVERPVFLANDGDLVCVANFPGAVVDVAIRSSANDAERSFEAYTERIPPVGTKVRVIFEPQHP
jgi:hypothetical protein